LFDLDGKTTLVLTKLLIRKLYMYEEVINIETSTCDLKSLEL